MDVIEIVPDEQEYQPSISQLERAAAIRRFNIRFVYVPIGLVSLVGLITVVGLLYLAVINPTEETTQTISGMADAFTILGVIPLLFLCAIFPALAIGVFVQGKRRGMAPLRRLQLLFWRMDVGISSGRQVISRVAQKLANPFITFQGGVAFFRTLLNRVSRLFKQG